jgi:putative SOS response-associated peptidase YedK
MCGRFTSLLTPELLSVIREIFGVPVPETVEPRYNIAPTQMVRVLRNEGDHNRYDLMKWGLVPFWAKDPSIGSQMINARSESVREKPVFRQAIKYRRCIIPSSGFYEWLRTENRKQPYFIHMADSSPMYFAGIWEQWMHPGEEGLLESFSILTTAANELVAPIHDRRSFFSLIPSISGSATACMTLSSYRTCSRQSLPNLSTPTKCQTL